MRTHTYDMIADAENANWLTTGEASFILNASRQHVVNLCERGDLPFVTIGAHRRVRRADVESLRTRSQRLTRDQRRSLWLSHAVAGMIVEDPARALSLARKNLANMQSATRGQARRWLEAWEELLDGPLEELLEVLVSPSPKGREMRQNSPFAGLVSQANRERVLDAWKANEAHHKR